MNGPIAWLAFADLPGVPGTDSDGVCPVVRPKARMAMNTWILVAWGVLGTIGTIWGAWLTWGGEIAEEASE